MGFVFLSLWGFLAAGVIGLIFKLLDAIMGTNLPSLTGKGGTAIVFTVVLLTCIYGYQGGPVDNGGAHRDQDRENSLRAWIV